jgi:hypothetical protein
LVIVRVRETYDRLQIDDSGTFICCFYRGHAAVAREKIHSVSFQCFHVLPYIKWKGSKVQNFFFYGSDYNIFFMKEQGGGKKYILACIKKKLIFHFIILQHFERI